MKYVCLGFFDESKFAEMPQEEAQKMMEECLAYDDELRRGGTTWVARRSTHFAMRSR